MLGKCTENGSYTILDAVGQTGARAWDGRLQGPHQGGRHRSLGPRCRARTPDSMRLRWFSARSKRVSGCFSAFLVVSVVFRFPFFCFGHYIPRKCPTTGSGVVLASALPTTSGMRAFPTSMQADYLIPQRLRRDARKTWGTESRVWP